MGEPLRWCLDRIDLLIDQLAIIQLLVSQYLNSILGEEEFLADFNCILPDAQELEIHLLPSALQKDILEVLAEVEKTSADAIRSTPSIAATGTAVAFERHRIGQKILALERRLETVQTRVTETCCDGGH